jgi:hypothetical protein
MRHKLPEDIEAINRQLISKFGSTIEGNVKFRLIWSNFETEHRKRYHKGGIELLYPIVEEVPKYGYLKDRWVLERFFNTTGNAEVIPENGGIYEPVWCFQNKDGESLRPIWRAVEIIASAAEGGIGEDKKSMSDFLSDEKEEQRKEIEMFENMLDDGTNYGNQTDAFVKPLYLNTGGKR